MMRRTTNQGAVSKAIDSSNLVKSGESIRIVFFQQISDSVRHSILNLLLKEGQISVSEILSKLNKPQTLISYHLRCLKEMGLVNAIKDKDDGRKTLYSLHSPKTIEKLFSMADNYVKTHANCGNTTCKIEE